MAPKSQSFPTTGSNWGLSRAYRVLFSPHSHKGRAEIALKGPFWLNWHLSDQAPLC